MQNKKHSILFICHGNICRSPMAEFVLKHLVKQMGVEDDFYIASAATSYEEIGNDIHRGTRKKLKEEGIPFEKRAAVRATKQDYDDYDYLIVMDRYNVSNLSRIVGVDKEGKIKMLLEFAGENRDIADPWYTGNFDKTYDDVLRGCEGLLRFLGY
ncbi:MAG TPA: low molecular weight phosphotyrosine protein phosphatase [Firmicutes bacterium]|nr:low molecular weight phosphotyrosine protein phosphatase [Bacillota bacterium]